MPNDTAPCIHTKRQILPAGKVSVDYRADFFFGAHDGGLAAPRKSTKGFYGPFASVSIGLGG